MWPAVPASAGTPGTPGHPPLRPPKPAAPASACPACHTGHTRPPPPYPGKTPHDFAVFNKLIRQITVIKIYTERILYDILVIACKQAGNEKLVLCGAGALRIRNRERDNV